MPRFGTDHPQQADGVCRVISSQIGRRSLISRRRRSAVPPQRCRGCPNAPTIPRWHGTGHWCDKARHVTPAELDWLLHRAQPVHHSLRLSDFVITAGERDQLTLTTRGAQHLVDSLAVVGNQRVSRLQDRAWSGNSPPASPSSGWFHPAPGRRSRPESPSGSKSAARKL